MTCGGCPGPPYEELAAALRGDLIMPGDPGYEAARIAPDDAACLYPAGLQWYWKADFFNEISDAAIDLHVKYGQQLPTGHSTMRLYPIDGAASRVPADATAFAYRDGGWAGVIVGVDPDPANAGLISQWARDYWQALHPTSAGGAYVNFLMNEGRDRVKAAYRGNYDRLAQVKERYDPDNAFHINQNIQPASGLNP